MKRIIVVMIMVLTVTLPISADTGKEEAAVAAAEAWVVLVDSGEYSKSWAETSLYFQNAVDRKKWETTLNSVRKPLGKVLSRKLLRKKYTQVLPGAPDGEYVVIQFETAFTNKASSTETITPMLEKDGIWRVSGYYIH